MIPFTKTAVKAHLDELIRFWRKRQKEADGEMCADASIASCYVDAYQTVRKNLFGELLEEEME